MIDPSIIPKVRDDLFPAKYDNHILPGYYVNDRAELWTTRNYSHNQYSEQTLENVCFKGKLRQLPGTAHQQKYILFRVKIKYSGLENLEKYKHLYSAKRKNGQRPFNPILGVQSHQLVMQTLKPFEENLPLDLVDEWPNLSATVRRYIKAGMTVDHRDPDPTKHDFHWLSNLEWETLSDNARKGDGWVMDEKGHKIHSSKLFGMPQVLKPKSISCLSFI